MASKNICGQCHKSIQGKKFLRCSKCKQVYDLACARREKLFYLMEKDSKETWVCLTCKHRTSYKKTNTPPSPISQNDPSPLQVHVAMDKKLQNNTNVTIPETQTHKNTICESDNITVRKYNVLIRNSFESLSDEDEEEYSNLCGDTLNRSCPELNSNNNYEIEEMKSAIKSLQEKFDSANIEIENLSLENSSLKKQLSEYALQIKHLQNINKSTPKSTPKTNKKSKNQVNGKFWKSDDTQIKLKDHFELSMLKESSKRIDELQNYQGQGEKRNITIFSSNNQNKVLSALERNISDQFTYCHYITPKGGIKEMVKNIEMKVEGLTMNDYCIFLIGNEDFYSTENYIELIYTIRKSFQKIINTNKIICAPTYICGSTIHNCRVETFNNLLYLDTESHKYAACFDSNRNLKFDMFSMYTGRLNNQGMNTIMQSIAEFIEKADSIKNGKGAMHHQKQEFFL
jgi:hypothetical protein